MPNYHNILFATDLSSTSDTIGDRAMTIAQEQAAILHIVHVMEYQPELYAGGIFGLHLEETLEHTLLEEVKPQVIEQAQRFNIQSANQWLICGSSKNEIVQLAKRLAIDLIVIGSHDRHGLSLLFSNTTDAVLHAMPCDILAVKVEH